MLRSPAFPLRRRIDPVFSRAPRCAALRAPLGRALRPGSVLLALLPALLLLPSGASPEEPLPPGDRLEAVLDSLPGTPLPLREAIDGALRNSTSVREAEAAYLAAGGTVRREAGTFDPELFLHVNHLDEKQPSASFFAGAPTLSTTETDYRTGLRLKLPIGTNLELGLNASRLKTNSSFAFLNPEYDAFGSLDLRQPILGGFSVSARKNLLRSKKEFDAAKGRYDQAVLGAAAAVERAYWDLYAAERDLAVQILALDRARAFLRDTEVRAKAGFVGPDQVASAETFLAEQELLLLDGEEEAARRSDRLASLTGLRASGAQLRFVPADEPPRHFPVGPLDDVVRTALEENKDLRAAHQDIEAARALSRAASWEALPSVDLTGSLRGRGLAGDPRDVYLLGDTLRSEVEDRGMSDAVRQAAARDYPGWSVGVEITVPIGFREGLGEKKRLDAEVLRAEQRAIEESRVLEEEVRAAHRELVRAPDRLRAAATGVGAAEEQVRIGLIEFNNGRSTAFEVVRLSEDLASAQRRYSDALVRAAKAAATLRELTSATIE